MICFPLKVIPTHSTSNYTEFPEATFNRTIISNVSLHGGQRARWLENHDERKTEEREYWTNENRTGALLAYELELILRKTEGNNFRGIRQSALGAGNCGERA